MYQFSSQRIKNGFWIEIKRTILRTVEHFSTTMTKKFVQTYLNLRTNENRLP